MEEVTNAQDMATEVAIEPSKPVFDHDQSATDLVAEVTDLSNEATDRTDEMTSHSEGATNHLDSAKDCTDDVIGNVDELPNLVTVALDQTMEVATNLVSELTCQTCDATAHLADTTDYEEMLGHLAEPANHEGEMVGPADLTEDESFMATIGDHLKEHRLAAAVDDLANESNRHFLYEHGLDLVPLVGECLSTATSDHPDHVPQSDVARRCQDAFQLLAERGNPKEVLLELLGQLETGVPSPVQFHVLLPPVRTALLRTAPARRDATLRWVLDALATALRSLPAPPPHAWVDAQDDVSPPPPPDGFLDPDVETVSGAADELVRFLGPLVEEVSLFGETADDEPDTVARRHLLAEFEVALLGEPFCFLDLSADGHHHKSFQRLIAEHLVVDLCKLESDFYRLYHPLIDVEEGGEPPRVSALALATFAYLVHGEGVCSEHVPAVYSHRHALRVNMPLASLLLRHEHPGAADKGLRLAGRLIDMLAPLSLGADLLDTPDHLELGLALADVAVYCRARRLRVGALGMVARYVERFDADGRFALLYRMLNVCAHSGVQDLLIQLFKNNLRTAFDTPSFSSVSYVGRNLSRMLQTVMRLEQGVRTDLTERCERTLAALNLFRYLLLRDRDNVSGVWTLVPTLRDSYLRPLQTALDLSRTHYLLEQKRLCGPASDTVVGGLSDQSSLTVNGMSLEACRMTEEEELEAVRSSLTAFDLIQSVLCRVNEVLDGRGEPCRLVRANSVG